MEKIISAIFPFIFACWLVWEGWKGITKREMTVPFAKSKFGLKIKVSYMSVFGWLFLISGLYCGLLVIQFLFQ